MVATLSPLNKKNATYYTKSYYLNGQADGEWLETKAASVLDLAAKPVMPQEFQRLLRGLHPQSEAPLVQNADSEDRQLGWDVQFAPDKSFSIKNESTASGGETPKGSAVPGVKMRRSSVRKAPWGRRTAMKDWQSQSHVKWDCKYHVVILPKYRRKVMYGRLRRGIGQILRDLCRQKDIGLVEGKAMPDHIHMLLSVPPRYSIAMTIGYLKGKSATRIHRELLQTKGTLFGRSFWARGYCVSTVGLDEVQIRRYIREQDQLQRDQDQGELNLD